MKSTLIPPTLSQRPLCMGNIPMACRSINWFIGYIPMACRSINWFMGYIPMEFPDNIRGASEAQAFKWKLCSYLDFELVTQRRSGPML